MANRYLAQEKRVFDISKFTVVGSPTITSDGIASGFDSANANNIQIPTDIISQIATANTWKVEVGGAVQESGFTYGNIRTDNNIRYDLIQLNRYANGFIFVCCLDENGTATTRNIPITFSNTYNGKAYKATLEFTGTKYIATVQFEDGEVLTNSLDSTYKIKFFNYGDKFELGYNCINGSIDLTKFKITVDGQTVFTGTKPVRLLERRKPKVWNKGQFTIVGNPSISDDGVLTISTTPWTNGVRIPWDTSKIKYRLEWSFKSSGINIGSYYINNNLLHIYANEIYLMDVNGLAHRLIYLPDAKWQKYYLNSNEFVDYYVEFDGTSFEVGCKLQSEIQYTTISGVVNYELRNTSDVLNIGIGNISQEYGSINLKSIKYYTDNNLVFDGGADTYVYDPSKFTIIGSPTITEYGVASGFSSSNYIRLGQGLLTNANIWELEFDYDTTDMPNIAGAIFQNVQTSPTYSGLVIQGRNHLLSLYAGSGSGTTWDIINDAGVFIQQNAFNKIRIGYNGTKYYCFVNGVEEWSLQSDLKIAFPNSNCVVGYHNWWGALQYGSINLPSFSITVDGKEVFTGAKENYYVLRSQ